MRRNVFSRLDDLDLDARQLAKAAAHRAGMSLEEWAAALAGSEAGPASLHRKAGSDLDSLIARISPAAGYRPRTDYDALMAAVAAENERHAQAQASRTAVALESMASWIEQAEVRLNDAARASVDQQDRIAAILSQALSSVKDRLDTVERRVASEPQAAAEPPAPLRIEFPMKEALEALAPVSDTLVGLKADMSRLVTRLERPAIDAAPAVETILTEIDALRSGIGSLATREEIAALDTALGAIATDIEKGPTTRDLRTLASSITILYEQIQALPNEVSENLHRRVGREIDHINGRIDAVAGSGIDRSVIEFLSSQIVDMRHDLANRAEPQQIARIFDDFESLGRQVAELRLHQASKSDLTALKASLDDVCSALYVTVTQETRKVPDLLESVNRRLDLLADRPEPAPADLTPITDQLALLTERMAALSSSRSENGEVLAGTIERLSSQIEAVTGRESPSQDPLLQRFDRIEHELRELGRQARTSAQTSAQTSDVAQLLRSIEDRLSHTLPQSKGLDTLERQVTALAQRLEQMSGEALHKALAEAVGHLGTLRDEAAAMAERAARTVLDDIRPTLPDAGDFDALKHGLVELKALHGRSDRKTQETLRAVHEGLEALASRLPSQNTLPTAGMGKAEPGASPRPQPSAERLEAAVRRLHVATLSQIEAVAPSSDNRSPGASASKADQLSAPDPILHSLLSTSSGVESKGRTLEGCAEGDVTAEALDASQGDTVLFATAETGLGAVRANFIAAARRASQHAAPDQAPLAIAVQSGAAGPDANAVTNPASDPIPALVDGASAGADEAGSASPVSSLFERLRRSFDRRRRPLLLGLAVLILAAGTFQVLPGETGSVSADLSSARQEMAGPVERKPADEASRSPLTGEMNLFQASSLFVGPVPADPLMAAQFLVDPATINGIPVDAPISLQHAARSGDAAALYEIASLAAEGRGMTKDMAVAFHLLERAAQAGLPPAQERLAAMHERGDGVARDLRQAAFWYERAAQGGNIQAMHNLATLLASGRNGKPDYAAALRWYGEAAEAGLRNSQFNMGILLAHGTGSKPDRAKAFQWFSLAAAQGDAEAARKRDELAGRLSAADLKAAKAALDLWRPRVVDPIANRSHAVPDRTAALDRSTG